MKYETIRSAFILSAVLFFSGLPAAVAVEVGDKAPDFDLPSTQGGKLRLSSFQGVKTVVIEFYVLDFTPT